MLSEDSDIKKLDEKGTRQIFIKPTYSAKTQADNLEIISTVIHEVLHAVLPASVGHSRKFEKVGKDFLQLAGKPTNMGRHNEDGKPNPDFDFDSQFNQQSLFCIQVALSQFLQKIFKDGYLLSH